MVQLAIRHSWLSSLLARLAREMGLGSLPLATVPQRFPCRVGSYFPHAAAHGCGFVMVDNVRGSDAVTPGRCRHCARSGLASTQEVICSHSPSKGSFWVRRQPRTRFLLSCSRYRVWIVADGSGTLFSTRSVPAEQHSTEKTRRGADGGPGTQGEQPTAQLKTACCNCSTCWKRWIGSSACATSVSSCCCWAGRTPDRSKRCSEVFAGS